LLTHTAGFNVHGFPGYEANVSLCPATKYMAMLCAVVPILSVMIAVGS
jgi:hypothetical protein